MRSATTVIVVPVYGRPDYFKECWESLCFADLSGCEIIVVNDASQENIWTSEIRPLCIYTKLLNERNRGVSYSVMRGCDLAFQLLGATYVITMDSDVIVKPNFVQTLIGLKERFPDLITTGFNSTSVNPNGKVRYPPVVTAEDYYLKKKVGGCNFIFDQKMYNTYVLPVLRETVQKTKHWDMKLSKLMLSHNKPIVVSRPSVVQHIGYNSSLNHNFGVNICRADDF